jgi:hypothetical protein
MIWFQMLRRGTVRMTQPSFIMFKADSDTASPSLAVGAHLYSTAQRGAIVEGMFARVGRGRVTQDLDIWVHGKKRSLVRGSGVHVGQEGVTVDHHFLLPEGEEVFQWQPGEYTVEIFGTVVGRRRLHRFLQLKVVLDEAIQEPIDCVFFDWQPALSCYKGRVLDRRERVRPPANMLRELILNGKGLGDNDGDERDE